MAEKQEGVRKRRLSKRNVTISLSDDLLTALNKVTDNRSVFIEEWMRRQPLVRQALREQGAHEADKTQG